MTTTRLNCVSLLSACVALAQAQERPVTPIHLVYEVALSQPTGTPPKRLGTLSVDVVGDRSLLNLDLGDRQQMVLGTKSESIVLQTSQGSSLAEIRPHLTTGKLLYGPLFPNGALASDLILLKEAPAAGRKRASIASPQIVAYGESLFYQPGECTFVSKGRRLELTNATVLHNGTKECEWNYSRSQWIGGRQFPGKITLDRYRASGLNIPSDDRTTWTLVQRSPGSPRSTDEKVVLPKGTSVQDNRDPAKTVSFTYDPAAGSLDEQADAARKEMSASGPPSSAKAAPQSAAVPIIVAVVGLGVGGAAFRRSRAR